MGASCVEGLFCEPFWVYLEAPPHAADPHPRIGRNLADFSVFGPETPFFEASRAEAPAFHTDLISRTQPWPPELGLPRDFPEIPVLTFWRVAKMPLDSPWMTPGWPWTIPGWSLDGPGQSLDGPWMALALDELGTFWFSKHRFRETMFADLSIVGFAPSGSY